MTSGYTYGEQEPKERCPYCGTYCHADFVDIGVGYQQCGPYHCDACGASEIALHLHPMDEWAKLFSEMEIETGWYAPGSLPGPFANVDENGKHIPYYIADTIYRESKGVKPRYDANGRYIHHDKRNK